MLCFSNRRGESFLLSKISLSTDLGPYMPHCRHSLGSECRRGASRMRKRKMDSGKESNELCEFTPPLYCLHCLPSYKWKSGLVLKSDNVPNDRIWFKIK